MSPTISSPEKTDEIKYDKKIIIPIEQWEEVKKNFNKEFCSSLPEIGNSDLIGSDQPEYSFKVKVEKQNEYIVIFFVNDDSCEYYLGFFDKSLTEDADFSESYQFEIKNI